MEKLGKAAVMTAPNTDLEIREYPLPNVEKGAMLVKIKCCTICGSDLHTWLGHRKSPTPIILGHEIIGEVVELGEGVRTDSWNQHIKVGDRVSWTVIDNCGKCYFCKGLQLPMKCLYLKKYGHDSCDEKPHFSGGFAEYCYISPGTCVIKIPDNLSDEEAAPANCALATVIAGFEAVELKPFENVLIQGAGALGVYAAALAKHYGCNRIIATDINSQRLKFIEAFGATDTINTQDMSNTGGIEAVRAKTNGLGVDAAFETAGVADIISMGLKSLRIGGRYVQFGNVFPGADFSYDVSDIIFRMLTIKGIHNYDTRHLLSGISFLSQTREIFPFASLIQHRVNLENIREGLAFARSGKSIRVAIVP